MMYNATLRNSVLLATQDQTHCGYTLIRQGVWARSACARSSTRKAGAGMHVFALICIALVR